MVKDKTKGQHIGMDGKPWKAPPGIRTKDSAAAQANKGKTADDTKDSEWLPMEPVVLDLSDKFDIRYTEQENYRAYKLFNIIDTSGGGSITLRELKRCLMGDTFRTFTKRFEHPDTGFILGLDEDDCVVIAAIEPASPASLDPFLSIGLQLWSVNGRDIPPNNPASLKLAYKYLLAIQDEPVEFHIVEPIIIITKFSCILDLQVGETVYSVTLPIGAVYNLAIFESKMRLALRKCSKDLNHIHMSFDGKRRQAYLRSHHTQFKILFQTGPNYQRSCRYALGFASEDSDFAMEHRGQPMVFDLALGVKQHEADVVLTELFEKFDEDKSGEFEFEEFRDFYIRFLDTDAALQLLRDYAQYKFRDLEKEAYYMSQVELAATKKKRRAKLKTGEAEKRKDQHAEYMKKSDLDAYGIRRRVYGGVRPENLKMKRTKPKKNRVKLGSRREVEEYGVESLNITEEIVQKADEDNTDSNEENALVRLTPTERAAKRSEIRARRKSQDMHRRLRLNEIFNTVAALNKQMRKDQLQMMGAYAGTHMIEVHQAIQRAVRTAVRTEDTGVSGITQVNVSLSHVIASPAFVVTAGMFTGDVANEDIDLRQMPPSELHPATQRYFLIRRSKRVNAEFDSEAQHPAFFTADYERQPSRHSSFGLGIARLLENLLKPGKEYRAKNGIDAKFDHVPSWDKPYRPESVAFVKQPRLKSDRIVGRMTLRSVRLLNLPQMNTVLPNSPFVTLSIGLHEDDVDFHNQREAVKATAKTRWGKNPPAAPSPEFRATTEVSALAGETALWEDLGWTSRVRANDWLTVDVYVGSARVNTKVGTTKISSLKWIEYPLNRYSEMELLLPILNNDIPMGQIRMSMKMEIGEEFDWFRKNYQLEQERLAKERKFKKWLSRQTNAPKIVIPFPLKFRIVSVELIDLIPVHLLTRNSPYIRIEFGDAFEHETDIMQGAGDKCLWPELNFDTHLTHKRNNLVFNVYSDMTHIGRYSILGKDLQTHPREKGSEFLELHATLTQPPPAPPGYQTGRMVVRIKFDMGLAVILKPGEDVANFADGVGYGEGEDDSHASMSTISYGTNYTPNPAIGVLPVRVRLSYLAASDLPPSAQGAKGTHLVVACGRWKSTTSVSNTSKGQNVEWEQLPEKEWTFPLMDRFHFSIRVMSGEKLVGTFALTAKELAEQPRTGGTDNAEVVEAFSDGSELVGKIKFTVAFDHPGDHEFANRLFHEMLQVELREDMKRREAEKLITGYGDTVAIPTPVGADGFKFIETAPFEFDYLPHHPFASQPTEAPFRVTIHSILAVDLRNAHTFSRNSPELNAACGQWAAVSTVLHSSGQSAGWPELSWAFFMYPGSSLRIAVWSKQVVIGIAIIKPDDLLRSPVDKIGMRDILFPLNNENDKTGAVNDTGKLKISFNLESLHDGPVVDKHAYKPVQINLDPPILLTLYTVAVMDMRNAHVFAKNSPFIKAACGNQYEITKPHINSGNAAKWENMMWSIYMTDEHTLKLSVQSDTVVIGHVILRARYLCGLPIDKYGLTALELNLEDGRKSIGSAGRIRIVCRIEAHFQEEEVSDEEELEEEKEARLNMVVRTDSKTGEQQEVLIPKVTHVQVLGVAVRDLRNMHTFTRNSPQVIMQCGEFSESTSVQNLKGKNASWLGLAWYYYITQTSVVKMTINSGSALIGNIEMNTQELYRIIPDDLNRVIIEKPIKFEGETYGYCKMQLILTDDSSSLKKASKKDDIDFKRFDHLADTGENLGTVVLAAPVLVRITKVVIIDLAPIHAGVVKNSPYTQISCGGFVRETSSKFRAGSDAIWEGDELDWTFVVTDARNIFQATILSGWSRAGTLSVLCSDIFNMPRGRYGELVVQGNLMKTYKKDAIGEEYAVSVGKMRISMTLAPFVSAEEQLRLDRETVERNNEKNAVPRTLALIDILKIEVADCIQVYGLFKNSPKVHLTFGTYMNSTPCAFDAGSDAAWDNLNWYNIPIRDKSFFHAEVYSGNEKLGSMKMSSQEFIRMVPVAAGNRDVKGNLIMEIYGQIVDGDYAKGMIGIICRIDRAIVQIIAELQMIMGSGGSLAGVESAMTGTVATGRFHEHIKARNRPLPLGTKEKYAYDPTDLSYNYNASITKFTKAGYVVDGTGEGFVATNHSVTNMTFANSSIADNDVGGEFAKDPFLNNSNHKNGGKIPSDSLDWGHSTISNVTPGSYAADFKADENQLSVITYPDSQGLKSNSSHPEFHISKDPSIASAEGSNGHANDSFTSSALKEICEEKPDLDTKTLQLTFNASMSQSIAHLQESADDKDSKTEEPAELEVSDDDQMGYDSLQSMVGKHSMLSNSTPTPVATRVMLNNIVASDMKHMHTFKKNSPQLTLECGDFTTKTKVALKAGQNCRWDDLSWVFVMQRMTFMRLTVHSDTKIIGSVAISTREILGIPKRGDKTIFVRNIEHDGMVTGKIKIICVCDSRESIGMDETLSQTAANLQQTYKDLQLSGKLNKVALKNPPKQSLVGQAVRKKVLGPPELPLTVKVISLAAIDVIPLHFVAPNSLFMQISMGPSSKPLWRKRTKRVLASGANATWTEVDWSFDIFEKSAAISISCSSGSTKAGALIITVKELLEIPRSAQGYTEVSGKLWTDDKLIAGQVICTLLLAPFISEEVKEVTRKRIEREFLDLGKTPRLLCYITFDIVTVSEMTQVYKLLTLSASMHKWRAKRVTENGTNKNGSIVWGGLVDRGWTQATVFEKSPFHLEIEGGKTVIGSATLLPEFIMAQAVDEEGHALLFCDLLDGDIVVGKISIGCTVSHELNTRTVVKRVEGKTYSIKTASTAGDDNSTAQSRKTDSGDLQTSTVVSPNVYGEALSFDPTASGIVHSTIAEIQQQIPVKEPHWSEQVRIVMLAVDGIRSMHTLSKNDPEVRLQCGDWKDASKAILSAGANATWRNLHFSSFRMKKRGPCEKLLIEVWSKRYCAGKAELPCELALEAPRDENNRAAFEVEIQHNGSSAGKVIFEFEFLPNWAEPEPEPEQETAEIVPGAKFDLNKTTSTYESTGTHLPAEHEYKDYTDLMEPTLLTDEPAIPTSPVRPEMRITLPSSPDTGGLMIPDAASLDSVSIGTGLTNQTMLQTKIPPLAESAGGAARPSTSRSAQDALKDSGRPRTSRSAADSVPGTPHGKTPLSGTSSFRSWATNDSPDSTFRSASSYDVSEGGSRASTRSTYSGDSYVLSRDSSARPDSDAGSVDNSSRYSDSSRTDYSSRSGGSSYYSSDYSSRSSNYTYSSRSGYSSRSSRSGSSRTDPITGGRTSRIDEEDEGYDEGKDEAQQPPAATLNLKPMEANGPASVIASQLKQLGALKPTKVLVPAAEEVQFDISPLQWFDSACSRSEAAFVVAKEFVRGAIGKALKMLVVEATGGDYSSANFPIMSFTAPRLIGHTERVTYQDLANDVATVAVKAAMASGGKYALNRILGNYATLPDTFGSGALVPHGSFSASDFISTARFNNPSSFDPNDAANNSSDDDDEAEDIYKRKWRKGRRNAVLLTTGLFGEKREGRAMEEAKAEKAIDLNDKVFGKVRGHFTVPILRGLFKIHDLLGFDVSSLDDRCIPTRPYMTACKPYGDWAAETGQLWTSNRGLKKKDMHLSYYDLSGQWAWTPVNIRLGQMIIFDFHDGGSGLVFCKLRVNYEMLEACEADENEMISCYCEAEIAQEYGGGITAGVIRCSVDLSVNFWERPLKTTEYWNEHRVHHWKTFPLIPISQGSVKTAHRHVANQYDRQMVIHPAFFGFRARWRGHDHDESRFINPIFMNYTYAKKPASKKMAEDAARMNAMKSSANPWHYDVMAASLGKCPVCGDGVAGCPRCFMMPQTPDGDYFGPSEFAYDPIKETALAAAAQARKEERDAVQIAREANRKRLLKAGHDSGALEASDSENEEDEVIKKYRDEDHDDQNKIKSFHTKLTTYSSIRLWRNVKEKYLTVFIKVLPGAYIRKIFVTPEDCVANLYHRFCSHSDLGLSDSKMILMPTSVGLFEMHPEMEVADEFQNKHDPGRLPLSRYGFKERGSIITLLFLPRYLAQYTVSLLSSFYERNSSFRIKEIPSYTYVDDRLPPSVCKDPVNVELSKICINLYNIQQLDYKNQYNELGEWFRVKNKAAIEARIKEAKEKRAAEAEEAAKQRRLESQLKGFEGAEREAKLKALLENEKHKKVNVGTADAPVVESHLTLELAEKNRARLAMVQRKKARYLARLRGEHVESDDEEEEEEIAKTKANAGSESAKPKVATVQIQEPPKSEVASKDEDADFLYDGYSDGDEDEVASNSSEEYEDDDDEEEEEEEYDDEYDEGEAEDGEEDLAASQDDGRYEDMEDINDKLPQSAQSTGRLPDDVVAELALQQSQFEAMDEDEVNALMQGSRTSSRPVSGSATEVDPELLHLQLGDATRTTADNILSYQERNVQKLVRMRRAARKEKERERLLKEGLEIPEDFDKEEEDPLSEYSASTGTYTSRTGWSMADDWALPSLPSSTPPMSSRPVSVPTDDGLPAGEPDMLNEGPNELASKSNSGAGSRRSSKGSKGSKSQQIEVEYDEEGNPIIPLSPRGLTARSSVSAASSASTTTIVSTSTDSTVFSQRDFVPRLKMNRDSRPSTGDSSYSGSSYTSRSGYSSGSYSSRSSLDSHRMGTLSDSSRPSSSSTDYTSSSYYSSRPSTGSSAYTDDSYAPSSGRSRFSFGAPRGNEDPDEKEYREKYGDLSSRSGSSYSYSNSRSGYSTGSYSSRSGSTFTDFSSNPSTGRSSESNETSASYATFGSHKPTVDGSNVTSARDSDFTYSGASSARTDYTDTSEETSASERKARQLRAAGGGYGKGSRKPDHRIIYKQLYGSSKGPAIPKEQALSTLTAANLEDAASVKSSSLGARMSARVAEGSAALIAQGAQKDSSAGSKDQVPPGGGQVADSGAKKVGDASESDGKKAGKKGKKGNKKDDKEEEKEEEKAPEPEPEPEPVRVPVKRPPLRGNLAPVSPREGAFRLKDKHGRGEDEVLTDPSPLARQIQLKAEEEAVILSLSNPNSRPTTKEKKQREKKK